MDPIPDHPPYLDQNPAHRTHIAATVRVLAAELGLRSDSRIVDLGCNTGDWLRGFLECGFENVIGIDQESMRPHLLIPEKHFIAADLRRLSYPMFSADVVLCMEVGEHMEERYGQLVVDTCVGLAAVPRGAIAGHCFDIDGGTWHKPGEKCPHCWFGEIGSAIVFSAATPGQGGHGHVNEQPSSYWAEKFAKRGRIWDESIREKLPGDLVWWYRRNMAICRWAKG